MPLRSSSIIAIMVYTLIGITVLVSLIVIPTISAQVPQKFMAKLTGQNEVPAKNTKAMGTFQIYLTANGRFSNYMLNLTNISNVTLVQIHQGGKGMNGPIVFTLYKSANSGRLINGTFLKGKIFSNQFEGPLADKYISDLMKLIGEGNIYVNVHTKQNPQGEIRGQLT